MKKQRILTFFLLFTFASPIFADSYNLMIAVRYTSIILQSIAIALGVSLLLAAFFKFKRYGEMRTFMSQQMSIAKPLGMMIAGVSLLCLPMVINTLRLAIFGVDSPLAYPAISGPESTQMIKPVIGLVRIVGVIGIMRGLTLVSRAGGEQAQPGTLGKAILHLVGGVMCLHITDVCALLIWIFGFTVS